MPDAPDRRVYAEHEIGRILQRASELQGQKGQKPTFGLTLAELQQLARDSDIDPGLVAAAAMELSSGDDPAQSTFLGGPLTLTLRRRIDGHVSEETWSHLVSAARRKFESSGQMSQVGSTREWSAGSEFAGSASLGVRERDGYTEVDVFWSEGILPVPFIVVPLMLCIIGLPIVFESLAMSGLAGTGVWALYAFIVANIARIAFRKVASMRRRGIAEFADSIVAMAEVEIAQAAETGSIAAHDSRNEIEIPDLEADDTTAPSDSLAHRTQRRARE